MRNPLPYCVCCFVLCLTFVCAYGQTRESLEKQRAQTQKEIEETEKLLQQTLQQKSSSLQAINLLNSKIQQRNNLISSIRSDIAEADRRIAQTNADIAFARKNIEAVRKKYAAMVQQAYRLRNKYTDLMLILGASNLNEAYLRTKYFKEISDYRKKQVAVIAAEQEALDAALAQLQAQRTEKTSLLQEEQQEQNKLNTERQQQDKLAKQLNVKESQLKKDLAAQKKEAEKLEKTIQDLIAKEAARRKAEAQTKPEAAATQQVVEKLSATFKENRGKLPWPCAQGVITGRFGTYAHPIYKDISLQNSGIDITAPARTTAQAIFEGEVLYLALVPGSNMAVVIQHGNYISLYQNLVDVPVKKGDHVATGQPIGTIYTDPQSQTGTLHLEIWEGQTKLNPAQWLRSK